MLSDEIFLSKLEPEDYKLVMRLRRQVGDLMDEYKLLEEGDKVMVCLSGGKDSYTMLDMMLYAQKKAPFHFEIIAVNLDQKQPDFPEEILPAYLDKLGVNYRIVERDTYSIVKEHVPEGKTMCSLCSRMRRGTLYGVASEMGITKIALGHHKDDILETFFLNMLFAGKLEAMPAKYRTDDGEHVVIRPLAYCREKDIERYSVLRSFPIIPCNLCGSQPNMQRKVIKKMLNDWDQLHPNRSEIIFTSLQNVHPSHLMDKNLFDFANLEKKIPDAGCQIPDS
ncbi:MAG TPA: tRNA 2-thiocytidine(32) synthetase TtcA [Cytophagaceae bacterium]|jgi:tRNA 2-thiocytidine biosynthesis protein TtcA|nr:tRNA 2-thiocytidine(32) synthetase TtcA [Cytophagaceae bacterium]